MKVKLKKNAIIELITIFVLTLLFTLFNNSITSDEVWNYGFSYNIATGLIPYKDFNMVVTPVFPMLGSFFLSIFGKNILVFTIFNSLICTTIFYFLKKNNPQSYYISYTILLLFSIPTYTLFCLLLLYIIIDLEDKKTNDILIGITLGITFLTKQNIGIYLLFPTFLTKNIKQITKRIIGFIIPNIILLIYLLLSNSFHEFIDYCFLGISSFKENFMIYPYAFIIPILAVIYIIFKYHQNHDKKLLYFLSFQLLSYPIIDPYHVIIPFIPVFNYFLNTKKYNKKIVMIAFLSFILAITISNIISYHKNIYVFSSNTNTLKYRKLTPEFIHEFSSAKNYISNIPSNYNLYIISSHAYLLKLETNLPINKYDLLNKGNLGSRGYSKIITEIDNNCQNNLCLFLIYDKKGYKDCQYDTAIIKYITDNYTYYEDIPDTPLKAYINTVQ